MSGRARPRAGSLLAAALSLCAPAARAQSGETRSERAGWLGIMTDWQLRGPWSVWLDGHYNSRAFVVLRTGLTYRFEAGPALTGGYAHLLTQPESFGRNEHRPWAQIFFPVRFSPHFSLSHRLRFDLRIREKVENDAIVDGWIVVPRWRSQSALNYWFLPSDSGGWFVSTALEVLVNGGANAGPNYLDQNRVSLMLGFKSGPLTVRAGYLDRFVPGSTGLSPVHEHNAVLWISYRYQREERSEAPQTSPEAGNP